MDGLKERVQSVKYCVLHVKVHQIVCTMEVAMNSQANNHDQLRLKEKLCMNSTAWGPTDQG